MRWLVILLLLIVGTTGIWYFRGGSLELPSGNKYSALVPYAKKLPFRVYAPKYVPAGFLFQERESIALSQGTNIGIPQFNLLFIRKDSEDAIAFRQFDRERYKADILDSEKILDFDTYFRDQLNIVPTIRDDKKIYMSVPGEKKKTIFGDLQYIATGYLLRDDSLIQINYSGSEPLAEEEIIKIILSVEPF